MNHVSIQPNRFGFSPDFYVRPVPATAAKRPIDEVEQSEKKVYTPDDLQELKTKLDHSRYIPGQNMASSQVPEGAKMVYLGAKPYELLASATETKLNDLVLVPREEVGAFDYKTDPVLLSILERMLADVRNYRGDPDAFKKYYHSEVARVLAMNPNNPGRDRRYFYYAMVRRCFLLDPQGIFGEDQYKAFVSSAFLGVTTYDMYLGNVLSNIRKYLEANNIPLAEFYARLVENGIADEKKSGMQCISEIKGIPVDLTKQSVVLAYIRRAFLEGPFAPSLEQRKSLFFDFQQAAYLHMNKVNSQKSEEVTRMLSEHYSKMQEAITMLEDKYEKLLRKFYSYLDSIYALVEKRVQDESSIGPGYQALQRIQKELTKLEEQVLQDLHIIEDQVLSFQDARKACRKFAEKAREWTKLDAIDPRATKNRPYVVQMPYLCKNDALSLDVAEPDSIKLGQLIKSYYDVFDSTQTEHEVYFRKVVSAIKHAQFNLAEVLEKYFEVEDVVEARERKIPRREEPTIWCQRV